MAETDPVPGTHGPVKLLPGGPAWPGPKGHWEVTHAPALARGFSSCAADVVSDASRDPDFFESGVDAAHAMTPDDVIPLSGEVRQEVIDAAIRACRDRIVGIAARLREAAEDGRTREALYRTGYLLHTIEDLAVHRGRTLAEHLALGLEVDWDPVSTSLAGTFACHVLGVVRTAVGEDAWGRMVCWSGDGALSTSEKVVLLGREKDFDPVAAAGEYLQASLSPPDFGVPVRWSCDEVLHSLAAAIHEAPPGESPVEPADLPPEDRWSWRSRLRTGLIEIEERLVDVALELTGAAVTDDVHVIILPGIMASELRDENGDHGLLWVDPIGLMGCDFEALALSPSGQEDALSGVRVAPGEVLPFEYDALARAVRDSWGVVVEQVGFDWRRPIVDGARAVTARISELLRQSSTRRVVIVGHSMGGLVACAAVHALAPEERRRIPGFVSIGTPWNGSAAAWLNLKGKGVEARVFQGLTVRTRQEVTNVVQTFWGLSDLLPTDDPVVLQATFYADGPLGNSPFAADQLASPVRLPRRLPDDILLFAIAGSEIPTPDRYAHPGPLDCTFLPGDGTVTEKSALPEWAAARQVVPGGVHMLLPLDRRVIEAVVGYVGALVQR